MLRQRHLPLLSSTKIKQLLTPNLSRARQNWTISVEIAQNVHQTHQDILHKLWENQSCWTFLYDVTFPGGSAIESAGFSEIRLPCISKSQHLSTNSLPKLNAAEYFITLSLYHKTHTANSFHQCIFSERQKSFFKVILHEKL